METQVISPVDVDNRKGFDLSVGDTVRVTQLIREQVRGKNKNEDEKYRFQVFEGIVIARRHGKEPGATFTVRRMSGGIGIEKIFPLYSPNIDKIEIVRRAKIRRAKLYFLRDKTVRGIRNKLRRMKEVSLSTVSEEKRMKAKKETDAVADTVSQNADETVVEANTNASTDTSANVDVKTNDTDTQAGGTDANDVNTNVETNDAEAGNEEKQKESVSAE